MEISTMKNCIVQDIQAAAKTAQNSFLQCWALQSKSQHQRLFPAFPWCSSFSDSCWDKPYSHQLSSSWLSSYTYTVVLWHHTHLQDLSRAFVTQSVNSGIYYTVFIFLTLLYNVFSQVDKIDFTRPTLIMFLIPAKYIIRRPEQNKLQV